MIAIVKQMLKEAIDRAMSSQSPGVQKDLPVQITVPTDERYGDLSTNVAMVIGARTRRNPRDVADIIARMMNGASEIFAKIDVAGPGFLNFYLSKPFMRKCLVEAINQGEAYGACDLGKGRKAIVEFVSANPTGPLHVGHGRVAAVGDSIANLLQRAGYSVAKEYYINDAGTQMEILGRSVLIRYEQLLGRDVEFMKEGYQGEYIYDVAKQIIEMRGDSLLSLPRSEAISYCTALAANSILEDIKKDLSNFGVFYDSWFSEKALIDSGAVSRAIEELKQKGFIYESEGALWFKTKIFSAEEDRVVMRSSGQHTYFASDIAYHQDKQARGFDLLVDIWGADHHGYVPRMQAVIQALGRSPDSFKPILVQFVNLLRGGQPVSMSTRAGQFVTLAEVVDEVGVDAARFFFLMRSSDSHLDFDLDLAKKESKENPVYYVQYAHARICSIFQMAAQQGLQIPDLKDVDLALLDLPEEISLIKKIIFYPDLIEGCAAALEPHRTIFYLQSLASDFHFYYNKHRVLSDDERLTAARLTLARAIGIILRSSLKLLGVSAPEKM